MENIIEKDKDVLTQTIIKQVQNAIPSAFEEMKRDKRLSLVIHEMDMQTLKMLDAVMRRYREMSFGGRTTSYSSLRPEELSERAINLYVSLVKGVYTKTIDACSSTYTMEELETVGTSLHDFNLELSQCVGNKNKKFYIAEDAMNTLKEVNMGVVERLSSKSLTPKTMSIGAR